VGNAELDIQQQIAFLESILWFNKEQLQVMNPFLAISTEAILVSIRSSLIELQGIKAKKI
jgi:hypothetical protein